MCLFGSIGLGRLPTNQSTTAEELGKLQDTPKTLCFSKACLARRMTEMIPYCLCFVQDWKGRGEGRGGDGKGGGEGREGREGGNRNKLDCIGAAAIKFNYAHYYQGRIDPPNRPRYYACWCTLMAWNALLGGVLECWGSGWHLILLYPMLCLECNECNE